MRPSVTETEFRGECLGESSRYRAAIPWKRFGKEDEMEPVKGAPSGKEWKDDVSDSMMGDRTLSKYDY